MTAHHEDPLYWVDDAVAAELRQETSGGPLVLVTALQGFVDAGHAGQILVDHLLGESPSRLVTFAADELVDLRSRRPVLTFDGSQLVDYEPHELAVDVARDDDGVAFLVMHGPEPDYRWERFGSAVMALTSDLGVSLSVHVHGIPMGVPHTRPTTVTTTSTRPELAEPAPWFGKVRVPAGLGSVLEHRFGQEGRDAVGLAVNVPHYLAGSDYPPAAVVLLDKLAQVTGLALDGVALAEPAAKAVDEVAIKVAESAEVAALVRALEQQYDAFTSSRTNLLADPRRIPSADELAEQFERYLAENSTDG